MARVGYVPTVSAYEGNVGQQLMKVGNRLEQTSETFERKEQKELAEAKKLYTQGLNINLYNSINELRNDPKLSADPKGLGDAMDKVLEKTLADVDDDDVKMDVMVDYQLKKGTYVNQAQNEFNRVQRAKAKSYAYDSVYANIDSASASLANALTGNATNDDIANYQYSFDRINANINAKNPDGTYIFTDSQRRTMAKDAQKFPVTAFESMYDSLPQEEKSKIRESINNDRMNIAQTEQGSINLRDAVGEENYQSIKKFLNDEEYKRVSLEAKNIKIQQMQEKINQYNTETALSNELDKMDASEALRILDEKQNEVSEKYYKAKQKALLSAKGIDAETQAETANEIAMDIASLNTDNPKDFIDGSAKVLEKIEEKYAEGELRLTDKKMFVKNLNKRQVQALPDYIEKESSWFTKYDFDDAKYDFDKSFNDAGMSNRAMLEYIRTITDKDYNTKQKKELVKTLVNSYKSDKLNRAVLKAGDVYNGYRYKGGDKNSKDSWEKI